MTGSQCTGLSNGVICDKRAVFFLPRIAPEFYLFESHEWNCQEDHRKRYCNSHHEKACL